MMAAEMAVIRLTHVADLPSPEELVRRLQDAPPPPQPQTWEDIAEIVSSVSPIARPTSRIARLPR